ncbi:MAG: hypothetical protein HYV33_05875 [Candidatus Kerfeldbacteria bacterium]|nr:hypothetical protein [Candidatus Kerfeldbacteria bacterium]
MRKIFFLFNLLLAAPVAAQATTYTSVTMRIEAPDDTVYNDTVYIADDGCTVTDNSGAEHDIIGPKAICALAAAAGAGDFSYELIDSDYGLYLNGINDDTGSASDYWSFAVDYVLASVGLADYDLTEGQAVLLSYGGYPNTPLQLTVEKKQLYTKQRLVARVTKYNDTTATFEPAAGIAVLFGNHQRITNQAGKASFHPQQPTEAFTIVASAAGYSQSNSAEVRVYQHHQSTQTILRTEREQLAQTGMAYLLDNASDSQSITEWSAVAYGALLTAGLKTEVNATVQAAVLASQPTVSDGASTLARHILALQALKIDARAADGIDYVARLKKTESNNQFGSVDFVNDDIYAGLALLAAGEAYTSPALATALQAAKAGINADGGASYAVSLPTSDVDTTAALVQLYAAVQGEDDSTGVYTNVARQAAVRYLLEQQNYDGGWGYANHDDSNTSSTALAVQGLAASQHAPRLIMKNKRTGYNFLENQQRTSGAFQYNTAGDASVESLNTAYAVPALLNIPLPVTP